MSAARDEDVFLDAEEEVTPRRRSNRKRRSTAGSSVPPTSTKKPRQAKKMPLQRSPDRPAPGPEVAPTQEGDTEPAPVAAENQDGFWARMGGMLGGMESRLMKETTDVKEQLGQAIGDLGSRVERAEMRLDNFSEEVHKIIDTRLAELNTHLSDGGGANSGDGSPPAGRLGKPGESTTYASALVGGLIGGGSKLARARKPGKSKEDDYWHCRRALRLRPIAPGNDRQAVEEFLVDTLGLGNGFITDMGPINVRRVPFGPGAKVKNEAVVIFDSVEVRDAVKSAAKNLAGKDSSYGVRLELPNHLKSAMSALQSVSYEIKQRYAGARRNVLFDDSTMDLVLDFCTDEAKEWRRMTSEQAVERKKKTADKTGRFSLGSREIDALLDGGTTPPSP